MEPLSEDQQNKIVEHLREYIQDLQDEQKWNESFNETQDKLIAAAKLSYQLVTDQTYQLDRDH